MRMILCLALLATVSAGAFGQTAQPNTATPPSDSPHIAEVRSEVERLLGSALGKDRTWAAYRVGKYGLTELAPRLIEMLKNRAANAGYETGAALDALIQLGVAVPAAALAGLFEFYPDEVMILLAREPNANREALFALARQSTSTTIWVAARNLLVETKAPGVAALLLSELRFKVTFRVVDNEQVGYGGGAGGGMAIGCGIFSVPPDYPPLASYELRQSAHRGGTVLATGRHPVYYHRCVVEPGTGSWVHDYSQSVDRNVYVLEYLADLVGTHIVTDEFRADSSHRLVWKNNRQYQSEVEFIKAAVEGRFGALKRRLVKSGVLSEEEAAAIPPNVEVVAIDHRSNRRARLPEITGVRQVE